MLTNEHIGINDDDDIKLFESQLCITVDEVKRDVALGKIGIIKYPSFRDFYFSVALGKTKEDIITSYWNEIQSNSRSRYDYAIMKDGSTYQILFL